MLKPRPLRTGLILPVLMLVTVSAGATLMEVAPSNDQAVFTLPAQPSGNVIVRLYVNDADYPDEGIMTVNGYPVELFGAAGVAANGSTLAWVSYTIPASAWQAGANTISFSYTRRQEAYRVDLVQIEYGTEMGAVQLLKANGRAPSWLDENDEIRIRLRPSVNRVYMCVHEDGSATGRKFLAWSPGDRLTPDFTQPLAPVDSCDKAICFAADDSTSTRDEKIAQACGPSG